MSGTTTTPYLGLTKPAVGASRDTWGALLNADLDIIDQIVGTGVPIGAIFDFAGPTAPPGFLICDGRLISRVTYAALFAVLGTYWGAGDGSTTFGLPPTSGRASVGPGTVIDQAGNSVGFSFTSMSGFVYNTITQSYLPNYAMATDTQGGHNHTGLTAPGGYHTHTMDTQGIHSHGGTTWGESNTHIHSGNTDSQGAHLHNVPAWGAVGGSAAVGAGGIATGNSVQTDVQGAHTHNVQTGANDVNHTHVINQDPGHQHNIAAANGLVSGIYWDGNHQHNVWLGGGGNQFPVLSPTICVTKIIYAGQQAVAHTTALAAPTAVEAQDELAAIRQELAQLRAFLAPPRPQRLLRAPLRGSH